MEEELKRGIEMVNSFTYNVYKTSTGLYLAEDLCNQFLVENKTKEKIINDKKCYHISDQEIANINQRFLSQGLKAVPNFITIFDLQLVLSLNVYVDTNHNNKLYINDWNYQKYNITPMEKRTINNVTCGNVTEEDITKIEELSKKEKIALKRKYIEVALEDEIKPAENLFMYYCDCETNQKYVRRDILELLKANGIEIEGKPRIIDDKNCYSITEKELLDVENQLHYRGIEQLLKPEEEIAVEQTNDPIEKEIDYPNEDYIQSIVKEIYDFKDRQQLFEKTIPYEQDNFNETVESYNEESFKEVVMPYIEKAIPYEEKELETVIIYKDARTNQLFVPADKMPDKQQEITTVMHKPCYEIGLSELDYFRRKNVIVANTYIIQKQTHKVLICNNNGQLFISHNTLAALGFYIENPYRISINKEIYEEITEDDIELIKGLESDSIHIEIIIKQIAPKRG